MTSAKKVGLGFTVFHLILFIGFVAYLTFGTDDGQSRLLWTIWLPIDFPVSLLTLKVLRLNISEDFLFWSPYVIHGIFGTFWWFALPWGVASLFTKKRK